MKNLMMLRQTGATSAVLLAAAVWNAGVCAADAPRRNVLFIMADDLNCAVGCYGDRLAKTPQIDRLAARGVRFDRAYCQYSVCNPSRVSIQCGLRPDSSGVHDNVTATRAQLPDHVFLPQAFRNAGYRTVKLGKIYHADVGSGDRFEDPASWDEDFREDKTAKNSPSSQIEQEFTAARGIRLNVPDEDAWDGKLARRGADWLGKLAAADRPFFLAVGFRRPHAPYIAPGKYCDLYDRAELGPPVEPAGHTRLIPKLALTKTVKEGKLTDEDWRIIRQSYRASISYMDAQLGLLLDALDRLNLWDNTVVVFASDHGYHLGEHGGLWHKRTLFEEGARVPLIVAAPGARAGATSAGLVELVDLYPTLGEACGVQVPSGLEGSSFAPLLSEPTRAWKPAAFTQVRRFEGNDSGPYVDGRSIRTDRWRYSEWDDGKQGIELYDHSVDPHEYRNLADDPASAETRNRLSKMLHEGWSAHRLPARTAARL